MAHYTKNIFTGSKLQHLTFLGEVFGFCPAVFAKMAKAFRNAYLVRDCIKTPYSGVFTASYLCRNYHPQLAFLVESKRKTKQVFNECRETAEIRN